MGTDFWLSFMDNTDTQMGEDMLKVMVSGQNSCVVTLTNPNTNWTTTANVVPGSVTTINVPQAQGYNSASCQVKNNGFHLTSTDTVSVYTSIHGYWNYDVANIYPTHILKDEYMIQSYPSDRYGSEFNIVATEDSTYVKIYLTSPTSTGVQAGDSISVLLPAAGKTYQVKTPAEGDFSGTVIKAQDCKKIAVFHGDVCVYVPTWATGGSCDHAEEQAVPTAYWGKDFIVVNTNSSFADRVRITSLNNSCAVIKNGYAVTTLNAGQTYEYSMSTNDVPAFIHTSQPACVNIFFSSTNSATGDPSMVTINPLEQKIKKITFASFSTSFTTTHYICVVARTSEISQIKLDGSSFTSNFSTLTYDPVYSYAKKQVSAGSHTLQATSGEGFIAYAYGMGSHESYAYSLGSNMQDLGVQMNIGNHHNVGVSDTIEICQHDSISVSMYKGFACDSIVWYYNDTWWGKGDTLYRAFDTVGLCSIKAYVYRDLTLCDATVDTLMSYILVNSSDTVVIDTTTCTSGFYWYGTYYTEEGSYTHAYLNGNGCKSQKILNLTFKSPTESIRTMIGCDSVLYKGLYFYENDTLVDGVYTAANGCDSVDKIVFKTYPSYETTQDIVIMQGDSIVWIDGRIYWNSSDSIYYVMKSIHGCDSVIRLNLHLDIPPHVDSMSLWVPNAFTPDEKTNNVFKVFSFDMISVHVYIYNRWGLYVNDFDGLTQYWDGTNKDGRPCKAETYMYLIEYTTKAKPRYIDRKVGTVTLLR